MRKRIYSAIIIAAYANNSTPRNHANRSIKHNMYSGKVWKTGVQTTPSRRSRIALAMPAPPCFSAIEKWKKCINHSKTSSQLLALVVALEGRNRGRRVGVGVVLLQGHLDIVLEVELGLGVVGLGFEINDKVILDGEN
jgi:hypothetical protein